MKAVSSRPLPLLITLAQAPSIRAIQRHIGALDPVIGTAADICLLGNSTYDGSPIGYGAGKCPVLIDCIMNNLNAADQAGLSAGASIVALLPTVLALVGAGPLELVQLAFVSPLRAIATCLFGVGLPSGLFRQLHVPVDEPQHPADSLSTRRWTLFVPHNTSWMQVMRRLVVDALIGVLAGIMIWRNYVVCTITMVTFRCEYSWLLLCWPMACVLWLLVAALALRFMVQEMEFTLDGQKTSWIAILALPYLYQRNSPVSDGCIEDGGIEEDSQAETTASPTSPSTPPNDVLNNPRSMASVGEKPTHPSSASRPLTPQQSSGGVSVRITMRHAAFWGWYEAGIEVIAVGIYLYATIVLGSTLFLTGQQSIEYTVMMVLSLAAIRVLGLVL